MRAPIRIEPRSDVPAWWLPKLPREGSRPWRLREALRRQRLSEEQYAELIDIAKAATDGFLYATYPRDTRTAQAAESRRVRRLEERGFARRISVSPSRRRTSHLELTDTGWSTLAEIRDDVYAIEG